MAKEDKRFIRVHQESNTWNSASEVWVDSKTGVNYYYHSEGYGGGMCVLVDAEGKPVITKLDGYGREIL